MAIEIEDSRRLTGPNLFCNKPAALIELKLDAKQSAKATLLWKKYIAKLLPYFSWENELVFSREYSGGASLGFTAPIDALYAAIDLNEYAWQLAYSELKIGSKTKVDHDIIDKIKLAHAQEARPTWHQLKAAAAEHSVTFLWDDDHISVGQGKGSLTWPSDAEIDISAIDWSKVHDIPVVIITGTNGKTTSVRITAAIAKAAGFCAGITSTDFLKVGDEIIDKGDYSGPGGAREILRNQNVDFAILEVARGGLLRRGLAVEKANASLVTNVASDHLGEYGINTVEELAEAKFIISKAIHSNGVLLVNADDELSMNESNKYQKNIRFFASSQKRSTKNYFDETALFLESEELMKISDIPISLGGISTYNLMNALAAASLCNAVGIEKRHIKNGLANFSNNPKNNPGRSNIFKINNATVIVDFAHNEHGMNAVMEMAAKHPAKRRLLMIGQAGDRSNADILLLCKSAMKLQADRIHLPEIINYLRGREIGELTQFFKTSFIAEGAKEANIHIYPNSLEAVKNALTWAKEGDLLLLMVLDMRDEILTLLETNS